MALTDAEKQFARDDEFFRAEVRKTFAAPPPSPPGFGQKVQVFFESKVGFWLLTSVIAGLSATGWTAVSNWLYRDQIATRAKAEQARQDFDTVIKVVPMLISENPAQRQIGLSLLNGLASAQSIQPEIAQQITATLQSIVVAGAAPNASAEARVRAGEVARLVDANAAANAAVVAVPSTAKTGTDPAVPALPPRPAALAPAIGAIRLPARVYVQIGSEARRPDAEKAVEALRGAGLLAPGIERVAVVPGKTQLRYCAASLVEEARDTVLKTLSPVLGPIEPSVLPALICSSARVNQYELWLGSAG